jgi:hypothetical protein
MQRLMQRCVSKTSGSGYVLLHGKSYLPPFLGPVRALRVELDADGPLGAFPLNP